MLRTLAVQNYRSLGRLVVPLTDLNVASWKRLAAAAPAAQQVGDQALCPGNIATAGREWAGTVTRLGSIYHGELRRLLGIAPDPMPAASRA